MNLWWSTTCTPASTVVPRRAGPVRHHHRPRSALARRRRAGGAATSASASPMRYAAAHRRAGACDRRGGARALDLGAPRRRPAPGRPRLAATQPAPQRPRSAAGGGAAAQLGACHRALQHPRAAAARVRRARVIDLSFDNLESSPMSSRLINFSAGPAALPEAVLRAGGRRDARLARQRHVGDGDEPSRQGVHRRSHAEAEAVLRELLAIPANYKVLFLQGGAIAQNAIVPMNLLRGQARRRLRQHRRVVEEVDQGGEASTATVNVAATAEASNFTLRSRAGERGSSTPDAAYVHICANETIGGVEYHCDARHRRRAAGRRHVVAHPVAPDRRRASTA